MKKMSKRKNNEQTPRASTSHSAFVHAQKVSKNTWKKSIFESISSSSSSEAETNAASSDMESNTSEANRVESPQNDDEQYLDNIDDADVILCNPEEPANSDEADSDSSNENGRQIYDNLIDLAEELHLFDRLCEYSDGTLIELLVKITRLYKSSVISKYALSQILEIIHWAMPKPNICPPTKYKYFDIVEKLSPQGEKHDISYFCGVCFESFEGNFKAACPKCDSDKTAVCVRNDVKATIKYMFEFRGLAQLMENEHVKREARKEEGVIYDVSDGLVYKNVEKTSVYDVCLVQNTDGFPYANSNSKQIWPNFLSISDISPALRSKFMILASIWFSPVKPNLMDYLTPFAVDMLELARKGITWTHPITKAEVNSKVFIVASTLDAQARAPVMSMNQYNGEYGCSYCEMKGERIEVGHGSAQVYPFYHPVNTNRMIEAIPRTRDRLKKQATVVMGADSIKERDAAGIPHPESYKGIKGFSPFLLLPKFDIINSFSPDILHSCFIGVVKRWTKQILNSKNHKKDYYVGKMITTINDRIRLMQTPSFVSRTPRSLEYISYWKASEYRNWLFYFSLPCLNNILPRKFHDHHGLLVEAIFILCKSRVTATDLRRAKNYIEKYCSQYAKFYGSSEETFNLHMLRHYTSSVENIGPLWATSTFLFESANGTMRTSIHGTMNIAMEMINSAKIHNALYTMDHISTIDFMRNENDVIMLGASIPISRITSANLIAKLSEVATDNKIELNALSLFERVRYKGINYTTESYCRATKTCTHYIAFKVNDSVDQTDVLKALYFVNISKEIQLVVGKLVNLTGSKFITKAGESVQHLQTFLVSNSLVVKNVKAIECPMFKSLNLLSKPPNTFELHM